jgi:hypothetical protein
MKKSDLDLLLKAISGFAILCFLIYSGFVPKFGFDISTMGQIISLFIGGMIGLYIFHATSSNHSQDRK